MYVFLFVLLGFFYSSVGNLPPRLRSTLHSIQMVAVVKTSHIEKYGMDNILEPFMKDLYELEKVHMHVTIINLLET